MNFYPGRKVVFPFIKNKFRFVTVSLLFTSLVTVVSSASAEEEVLNFSITVEDCTVSDTPPTWNPTIATGDGEGNGVELKHITMVSDVIPESNKKRKVIKESNLDSFIDSLNESETKFLIEKLQKKLL